MSEDWVQLKRVWLAFWSAYWREMNPVHRARLLGTITASLTIGTLSLGCYVLLQWFFADVVPTWGELKAAAVTGIASSGMAYQILPKHVRLQMARPSSVLVVSSNPLPDKPASPEMEESNER